MRKQINNEWYTAEAESQWYIIWNNERRKVVEYKHPTRRPHEIPQTEKDPLESMATKTTKVENSTLSTTTIPKSK